MPLDAAEHAPPLLVRARVVVLPEEPQTAAPVLVDETVDRFRGVEILHDGPILDHPGARDPRTARRAPVVSRVRAAPGAGLGPLDYDPARRGYDFRRIVVRAPADCIPGRDGRTIRPHSHLASRRAWDHP